VAGADVGGGGNGLGVAGVGVGGGGAGVRVGFGFGVGLSLGGASGGAGRSATGGSIDPVAMAGKARPAITSTAMSHARVLSPGLVCIEFCRRRCRPEARLSVTQPSRPR
jgi:hypothetical protein